MAHVTPLDGTLFGEDQPCFGCGPRHPFGLRLRFEEVGEALVTRMTPGPQHQGPLGVMHGGLVTTLADEAAGWAVIAKTGKFGFTTSLQARLRRPVRIGVEAECRAWLTKTSPRVVRVAASVSQGGEEC
ncbi:MAG: PaaI family thioesterase, partial [Deltaproteobacteria bacterium]|nr:PaaI family thioesterase [Deltaproteobacteria bacterium]